MIKVLTSLMMWGAYSGPLLILFAIVAGILIQYRKRGAAILAIVIALGGAALICSSATPEYKFAGQLATSLTCFTIVIGLPIVMVVAMLTKKPAPPKRRDKR